MREEELKPVLPRLVSLLGAGYAIRVQESIDNGDTISLEHPSPRKRVQEKSLLLYEDGDVFGCDQRQDGTHLLIDGSDDESFKRLVASTPRPTWWDLNCEPFYSAFAFALIAAVLLAGLAILTFVVDLLRGSP